MSARLRRIARSIGLGAAAVAALSGISVLHEQARERRNQEALARAAEQDAILLMHGYATPRSVADFFPNGR